MEEIALDCFCGLHWFHLVHRLCCWRNSLGTIVHLLHYSLDGDIITLDGDDSTLDGDIITLDGDDSTLDGDIITLDGDIITLDGDIITLDGDIITLDGDDSTLDAWGHYYT